MNLKQVAIAGLAKFLNSPALVNTDGVLSGETKISSDSGKMSANGSMNVQNAKIDLAKTYTDKFVNAANAGH